MGVPKLEISIPRVRSRECGQHSSEIISRVQSVGEESEAVGGTDVLGQPCDRIPVLGSDVLLPSWRSGSPLDVRRPSDRKGSSRFQAYRDVCVDRAFRGVGE